MTIDSRTLYATLLGLKAPWEITDVHLKQPPGEVHIQVALPQDTLWVRPQCNSAAPIHDHQERRWRHLDTCQYPTIVHARVPRLKCPTHGIKQLPVPWAEAGSRLRGDSSDASSRRRVTRAWTRPASRSGTST